MALFRSERGIGRGEIAESRVEVPFLAAFMVFCAVLLLIVHIYIAIDNVTIALAVSMVVFGVTVVRVDWGVAVLIIAMLLSPEIETGSDFTSEYALNIRYDDVLILVIFFGVLVKLAFEGRFAVCRPSPVNLGIAAYYLVCIISTCLALRANLPAWNMRDAFFVMLKMLEFYMIFFLVGNALRDLNDVHRLLTLFFVVAIAICGYCFVMLPYTDRVSAPFEAGGTEPNTLGGYLTVVVCLSVGLLTQAPTRAKRILFLVLTATAFVPFLYTLSRASYAALLAGLVGLALMGRKLVVLAAVGLILVLSPVLMPEDVLDRVNYTFQRGAGEPVKIAGYDIGLQVDKSTHERFYVWRKVGYLLHVAPWFGGGVSWETVLDSQYARVIMETGLIGLTAFLFLQYRMLRTCRQAFHWTQDWIGRGLALGTWAATIGLIAHAMGTISFLIVRIMEPFWFLMALTVVVRSCAVEAAERRAAAQKRTTPQELEGALRPARSHAG